MQIWAGSGKSALPICNYSQILYQFLTFTQNLKRSHIIHHQLLKDGAVRIRLFEFRLFRRIFNVVQCLLLPRLRLSSKESNDDSHQKGYNGQLRCKPHEPIEFVDTFVEYICCGSIFFVAVAIPVNMVFLDFVAIKHKQSSKQSPCCNTESVYD